MFLSRWLGFASPELQPGDQDLPLPSVIQHPHTVCLTRHVVDLHTTMGGGPQTFFLVNHIPKT